MRKFNPNTASHAYSCINRRLSRANPNQQRLGNRVSKHSPISGGNLADDARRDAQAARFRLVNRGRAVKEVNRRASLGFPVTIKRLAHEAVLAQLLDELEIEYRAVTKANRRRNLTIEHTIKH